MRSASSSSGFAAAIAIACCACGARTALRVEEGLAADASAGDSAVSDAKLEGDAPADVPPPTPCELALAGDPVPVLSFAGATADASEIVVLSPGDDSHPATIALKARNADANMWHPEIHVAKLSVDTPWPSGVVVDKPLTLFAFEAHEWGQMSHAPGTGSGLAMLWGYAGALQDPESLRFRTFDTESWTPGANVDVLMGNATAIGLVPGRGVSSSGTAWEGEGYGAAWRGAYSADAGTQPYVAVLSSQGKIQLGPFAIASPSSYPGREGSLVWNGTSWLVTTSFSTCESVEPFCIPNTMVVYSWKPLSGAGAKESLQITASFPTLPSNASPGVPHIAQYAGITTVGWTEREAADADAPRTLRVVQIGLDGAPIKAPLTLAQGVLPTGSIFLSSSELGVILMWPERGDTSVPPEQPGHYRMIVHHLAADGTQLQLPIRIPTTRPEYYQGTFAASISRPRGALLAWSAVTKADPNHGSIFLSRLDCK
ncbi:MAG: hypothetical protein HY898_00345 [Deltaproteobacteria bacterium]|nr:hypothetical protein [Deltaproteobacteria bacterium]